MPFSKSINSKQDESHIKVLSSVREGDEDKGSEKIEIQSRRKREKFNRVYVYRVHVIEFAKQNMIEKNDL